MLEESGHLEGPPLAQLARIMNAVAVVAGALLENPGMIQPWRCQAKLAPSACWRDVCLPPCSPDNLLPCSHRPSAQQRAGGGHVCVAPAHHAG